MRLRRLARLEAVPRPVLKGAAWASALATLVVLYQGWPGWAIVAALVLPWFIPFAVETRWLRSHYGWLALFFVLAVTQTGHYFEHVAQMVQIHVLHHPNGMGIIGVLNLDWVHFGWNTLVFLSVFALTIRFRRNPWLWATVVVAAWHQVEHTYLLSLYLKHGFSGLPGLLDMGGRIGGGLPIKGPDLHFIYNTLETAPLLAGFLYQLRRSQDVWLVHAFPKLTPAALERASAAAKPRRLEAGEVIVNEGEPSDACFVVVRGEVDVIRGGGIGVRPAVLGPGEHFGATVLLDRPVRTASVRARTDAELLELDAATFRELVESSPEAAEELRQVAMQYATEP
jgi:hypothetical protein